MDAGKKAFVEGFLGALPEAWDQTAASNNAIFAGAIYSGLVAIAKAKPEPALRVRCAYPADLPTFGFAVPPEEI